MVLVGLLASCSRCCVFYWFYDVVLLDFCTLRGLGGLFWNFVVLLIDFRRFKGFIVVLRSSKTGKDHVRTNKNTLELL